MSLKLLLVLPQFPQDAASGAARSMVTIAEMFAGKGFTLRCLATTASEGAARTDVPAVVGKLGARIDKQTAKRQKQNRPELFYKFRGVGYRLLDTGGRSVIGWEDTLNRQFDLMFDEELNTFQPDAILTFGGSLNDTRRRQRARRQGVRVFFGLRNLGYLGTGPDFWAETDAVLTPSTYLSNRYRESCGIESTALPSPIEPDDVIASQHDPIFFTMINPSPEKGLMLMARLAEEIGTRRPDIPLLIVESRGSGGLLVRAGLGAGFDLRRHENIMLSAAVPQPRDIFAGAKALLVPSLWQEPFGRVAAEALLNGVPPLVSNRGGLEEIGAQGGFVLDVPAEFDEQTRQPPSAEIVSPWLALIERLEDDAAFYTEQSARAKQAGRQFLPSVLAPLYVDWFLRVVA